MKKPIVRINEGMSAYEWNEITEKKNIKEGDKISVSVKVGKKRKIKKVQYIGMKDICYCDCCGPTWEITFKRGGETIEMTNVFWPSSFIQ